MNYELYLRFFMWCTILNGAVLLVWSFVFLLASDFVYRFHSRWFAISKERFDTLSYGFVAFFKMLYIFFNVMPYIALLLMGQ